MRILFMGTPEFAVPALEALVTAGHEVCGVFTQPDKPKNRGMKLQPTPVKACAQAYDIPVYQPVKLRDGTALELIRGLAPELIVVAAYGRILRTRSCPLRLGAASTCTRRCCPSTGARRPSIGRCSMESARPA